MVRRRCRSVGTLAQTGDAVCMGSMMCMGGTTTEEWCDAVCMGGTTKEWCAGSGRCINSSRRQAGDAGRRCQPHAALREPHPGGRRARCSAAHRRGQRLDEAAALAHHARQAPLQAHARRRLGDRQRQWWVQHRPPVGCVCRQRPAAPTRADTVTLCGNFDGQGPGPSPAPTCSACTSPALPLASSCCSCSAHGAPAGEAGAGREGLQAGGRQRAGGVGQPACSCAGTRRYATTGVRRPGGQRAGRGAPASQHQGRLGSSILQRLLCSRAPGRATQLAWADLQQSSRKRQGRAERELHSRATERLPVAAAAAAAASLPGDRAAC